jgi:DNA invertase Pin-like site-specific DNA recombinase
MGETMKKYMIFTASKLGTIRHNQNTEKSQERDIELFEQHYLPKGYKRHGELATDTYLAELFESEEMKNHLLEQEAIILVAYLSSIGSNANQISEVIDILDGKIMVAELPCATSEELKVFAKLEDSKKKFMGLRSKAGIKQAKAEGKSIGGLRGKTKERNKQKTIEANEMAESLKSYLQMFIQRGYTLKQGAELLNERGIKTAQGKEFQPMTVKRYLDRLKD